MDDARVVPGVRICDHLAHSSLSLPNDTRAGVRGGREYARVEVEDTGVGIPQNKLQDIWQVGGRWGGSFLEPAGCRHGGVTLLQWRCDAAAMSV